VSQKRSTYDGPGRESGDFVYIATESRVAARVVDNHRLPVPGDPARDTSVGPEGGFAEDALRGTVHESEAQLLFFCVDQQNG
jgi:hypothetical protein